MAVSAFMFEDCWGPCFRIVGLSVQCRMCFEQKSDQQSQMWLSYLHVDTGCFGHVTEGLLNRAGYIETASYHLMFTSNIAV